MRNLVALSLTPWILVVGCAAPPPADDATPKVDLAAEREAIAAADREFDAATAERGAEGWTSYFAEDGLMLSDGGGATRGPAAIREVMEPFFGNPDTSLRWAPLVQEVSNDATLGYTVGRYLLSAKTPDGEAVSREGKYLSVWRKQADGAWLVVADIGNPGLPYPEGTQPPAAKREAANAPVSRGPEAEEEALRLTIEDFKKAVAERGAEGWADFFASDGIVYSYGKPVVTGREAVRAAMSERFDDGAVVSLVWDPVGVELSDDATLAMTYGWYERTGRGEDGQEKVTQGKYVTMWRKQGDGSWKVAVDAGNNGFPGLSANEGTGD